MPEENIFEEDQRKLQDATLSCWSQALRLKLRINWREILSF
jgi:hypothetical protein